MASTSHRRTTDDTGSGEFFETREDENIESDIPPQYSKYRVSAFVLTFISYALFHVIRKIFSNVKNTISEVWSPCDMSLPEIYSYEQWNSHHMFDTANHSKFFLGLLDTAFMVSYSLGLFISGAVGDRLDLRLVLSVGMCLSSVSVVFFGYVSELLHIYNKWWYVIFWSLTGLLQSTGWPTVVAIMGNWFGKSSRGFVMGVWGASPSIGNILGAYTVAGVLHYGYQYAFLVPACITFAGGIIIYFSLIPSPREVGLPDVDQEVTAPDKCPLLANELPTLERTISARPNAIGFLSAFCLPGVLAYSLAYACLKLVNYSFFFWLPYYLHSAYGWEQSEADKLSVWYDVGGIIGGIFGGYVSDKLGFRSPVVAVMLILSPPALFAYNASPRDKVVNAVLMSIAGFFISGVANLISTAVAADLGRQKEIAESKEALATVTGIIDGTGSAGAAAGQLLIPVIEDQVGWKFVFYFFMFLTVLTLVCIIKIVIRDTKDIIRKWKLRKYVKTRNTSINDDQSVSYSGIRNIED